VDLGARVRTRRRQLGLTLRELGQRAGLSAAFLSQVERGLAKPALSSLVSLAQALQVSPEFLLDVPSSDKKFIKQFSDLAFFNLDGLPVRYAFLSNEFQGRQLEAVLVEIPKGYSSEVWKHPYMGEEFIFVISGILKLWLGNKEHELRSGDSAHFRSDVRHKWANPGSEITQVLWMGTPPFWR